MVPCFLSWYERLHRLVRCRAAGLYVSRLFVRFLQLGPTRLAFKLCCANISLQALMASTRFFRCDLKSQICGLGIGSVAAIACFSVPSNITLPPADRIPSFVYPLLEPQCPKNSCPFGLSRILLIMPHTRQTHTTTFHSTAAPRHTYVVSSQGHHNGRTVYNTRNHPNHYHPHHEYGPHQVGYYTYDSKPRRAHSVSSCWQRISLHSCPPNSVSLFY